MTRIHDLVVVGGGVHGSTVALLAARGGREEDVPDAVRATVATAGRAVFFSGLTVLLGLLGLVQLVPLLLVSFVGGALVDAVGLDRFRAWVASEAFAVPQNP